MKKILLSLFVVVFVVSLMGQTMAASGLKEVADANVNYRAHENSRITVDWNWHVAPTELAASYYDYSPGSYCSLPVRLQEDDAGDGVYMVFHATETAESQRRVYYSYVYPNDDITTSLLTSSNIREGYPGMDIDPDTGNPMYTWHAEMDGDGIYEVGFCLDQFNIMGQPGLVSTPYAVWHNTQDDNEYIWPYLFVGPSPNEGMRRVYIYGNNYTNNPSGNPAENVRIGYADFADPSEISTFNPDQWTYMTVPQMDDWHDNNIRPFKAFAVGDDGQVAFIGHTADLADDSPAYGPNDNIFIVENRNYGEDEWHTHLFDPTIPVENPDNYFEGESGPYTDMRYNPYVSGHHNAIYDDQGNLYFQAFFSLSTEELTWLPYMSTTKLIKYMPADDPSEDGEMEIVEVYPQPDPDEGHGERYLPWSIPPEYDDDGNLITETSWPCFWYVADDVFHEQYFKLTETGNRMALIYSEGSKSMLYNDGGDENYAEWANVPEMFIQASGDYGETWSEPIKLNSIESPELEGQIPVYTYIGDEIEDLGDGWGRIHIMYFDDNSYGSSIQGNGNTDGGTLMYASMDIDYGPLATDEEIVDVTNNEIKISNQPNPFNPGIHTQSTIKYAIPSNGHVEVAIHNIKGQKVKTLVNENQTKGAQSVNWNGRDNAGNKVASGVYFYKVKHNNQVKMDKMIILK